MTPGVLSGSHTQKKPRHPVFGAFFIPTHKPKGTEAMSTMTDTARVTETTTTQVKVENPATPRRGARFMNWLRGVGRSIRNGATRAWNWVTRSATRVWNGTKSAATTAVSWTKRGAGSLWDGVKYVGHRLYWSGAAFGRFIGRTMRFFGRSALTLVRATPRLIARTLGWGLRGVSFVLSSTLQLVFTITAILFLVVGLFMFASALVSDKYDQNVHRHTVSMARGQRVAKETVGEPNRATARDAAESIAERFGGQVVSETTTTKVTEVPVAEDENLHARHEEKPYGDLPLWQEKHALDEWDMIEDLSMQQILDVFMTRSPELPPFVPLGIGEERLGDLFRVMTDLRVRVPELKEHPDYVAMKPNDLFQAYSYWSGREEAFQEIRHLLEDDRVSPDWAVRYASIDKAMQQAWAVLDKRLAPNYEQRVYHRNSYKRGWTDQIEYMKFWAARRHELEMGLQATSPQTPASV